MSKIFLYAFGFVVLGLVIFALKERLGKRAFKVFWLLCAGLFVLILFYEFSVFQKSKQNEVLLAAFSSGKVLRCKDSQQRNFNVSSVNFTYDYGTKSFVSKEKSVVAQIFSIKKCEFYE